MPGCDNDARLDIDSFTCVACGSGTRSWGLQSTECLSCFRIWIGGSTSYYAHTMYEQLCTGGMVKSVILFCVVPIVFCITGCGLCCCATERNGLSSKTNDKLRSSRASIKGMWKKKDRQDKNEGQNIEMARSARNGSQTPGA